MVSRAVTAQHSTDFYEGVTSKLINKPPTEPQWKPAQLSQVSGEIVSSYFEPLANEVHLGSDVNFMEYPHYMGLPRERDIINVAQQCQTADQVMRKLGGVNRKHGMEERVNSTLRRHFSIRNGHLIFIKPTSSSI
jgi:3-hydroxyisobutyryl-CoA hydrolase